MNCPAGIRFQAIYPDSVCDNYGGAEKANSATRRKLPFSDALLGEGVGCFLAQEVNEGNYGESSKENHTDVIIPEVRREMGDMTRGRDIGHEVGGKI